MKRLITSVAALCFISACSKPLIQTSNPEFVARLEKQVALRLPDPGSARFAEVFYMGGDKDGVVCGYVTGKNASGSYGDRSRFVASLDGNIATDDEATTVLDKQIYDQTWRQCVTASYSKSAQ
jgi:hypothetical protein